MTALADRVHEVPDLTCRELEAFIHDFLEGRLSASEAATFNKHLEHCVPCQTYLEAYRTAVKLGKAAFNDSQAPVPDELPEDLVAAILAARRM